MGGFRSMILRLFWGQVPEILVTLLVSLIVIAFWQGIRLGLCHFCTVPEQDEIFFRVFGIVSLPSIICAVIAVCTLFLRLFNQAIEDLRNYFHN